MIFVTVIFAMGMMRAVSPRDIQANAEQRNADVLAEAKQGLVSWIGNHEYTGNPVVYGEFPHPDSNGDGVQDSSSASIGRLPWKTLGIAELKDSAGETLWYVVHPSVRIGTLATSPPTCPASNQLKPYGVKGNDLNAITGTCVLAIIFAPGALLPGQSRPNHVATNYLEGAPQFGAASTNYANYATTGPFIQGPINSSSGQPLLNDRFIIVTLNDLRLPPTQTPNVDKCKNWVQNGGSYTVGDLVKYQGRAYKCLQSHNTYGDPNWAPDLVPALWQDVGTVGQCNQGAL
ncbi:carbohydrate-binding protein [Chitinibacter tainanensis]|uniref:carbohydrate-binding protein n=1 Tax=Chitinibacter tainanensis TaxID=230667 RepID=UPI002356DA70|nr:carbohydrate-binding protein [Chitinibacter tainanensis]